MAAIYGTERGSLHFRTFRQGNTAGWIRVVVTVVTVRTARRQLRREEEQQQPVWTA
jgi:hypothetical protein